MASKRKSGFFDDAGFPIGGSWDEITAPGVKDLNAYALEISGDSLQPVYRQGDIVIVSPNATVRPVRRSSLHHSIGIKSQGLSPLRTWCGWRGSYGPASKKGLRPWQGS